jgi:8-oxo-dGTP pyrophosphatase MutT (NUDIX family)
VTHPDGTGLHPDFAALHADARAVLSAWRPPESGQAVLREEYLLFLAGHSDAMSRTCRVGHLTASALVMDEHRTRVLLTLHPKVGRWLQLGGHCEAGERSLRASAIRETREESGIVDVTLSESPIRLDRHAVRCGEGMSVHYDVEYLALVPAGAREAISEESDDLRWFGVDALPAGLDAAVLAMIDSALGRDPGAPARVTRG